MTVTFYEGEPDEGEEELCSLDLRYVPRQQEYVLLDCGQGVREYLVREVRWLLTGAEQQCWIYVLQV